MPRRLRPFSEYPEWCINVLMYFFQQQGKSDAYKQLAIGDNRNLAVSSAHMFNRARRQFVAENVLTDRNSVEIAQDIVCRITNLKPQGVVGQYVLEFVPRGLAVLADELRGSRRGLASPLADIEVPGLDEPPVGVAEAAMQKWLGAEAEAQAPCVHEADPVTGTRCIKCGKSIADVDANAKT